VPNISMYTDWSPTKLFILGLNLARCVNKTKKRNQGSVSHR
jgi:hypothetical protein